jgi:hypothetical protein
MFGLARHVLRTSAFSRLVQAPKFKLRHTTSRFCSWSAEAERLARRLTAQLEGLKRVAVDRELA